MSFFLKRLKLSGFIINQIENFNMLFCDIHQCIKNLLSELFSFGFNFKGIQSFEMTEFVKIKEFDNL